MSRLEKTLQKKNKRKRFKKIKKIVFIFFLAINAVVCICIVDLNANKMLGQKSDVQYKIENMKECVEDIAKKIDYISYYIKQQIN